MLRYAARCAPARAVRLRAPISVSLCMISRPLSSRPPPLPLPPLPPPDPANETDYFESEPVLSTSPAPELSHSGSVVYSALAGNALICGLKTAVWLRGGSPSMLAEALHSLVDTANQALLAMGLRQSAAGPDARFHFGHGRAAFVYGLLSACGMLTVAGGVPLASGVLALVGMSGSGGEVAAAVAAVAAEAASPVEALGVLGLSLAVDGFVLRMALGELATRAAADSPAAFAPKTTSLVARARAMAAYARRSPDPFLAAVILEDLAAVIGVLLAAGGVGASHALGMPALDVAVSMAIGAMVTTVAAALIRLNMRYLVGVSVGRESTQRLAAIIAAFPAVDAVRHVHTQVLGPNGSFLLAAKVDFDGTYLAAQLHADYESLFLRSPNLRDDLPLLLSYHAEDVTHVVEREVRAIEAAVRAAFPGAHSIQIEPDSKHDAGSRESESTEVAEVLEHHLRVLARRRGASTGAASVEAAETALRAWHARATAKAKSRAQSAAAKQLR